MHRQPDFRQPLRADKRIACLIGLSLLASPLAAQTKPEPPASTADALVAVASLPDRVFSGKRSRDVLAAQVMLDRLRFSPGVIDGYGGGNTARAVRAYQLAKGIDCDRKRRCRLARQPAQRRTGTIGHAIHAHRDRRGRAIR